MLREVAEAIAHRIMERRVTTDPVAWAVMDSLTGEWSVIWTRQTTGQHTEITTEEQWATIKRNNWFLLDAR